MTAPYVSRFAAEARAVKVAELVVTARARRVTAVDVAHDGGLRSMLVNVTGVREPSDETWAIVVRALRDLEELDRTRGVA